MKRVDIGSALFIGYFCKYIVKKRSRSYAEVWRDTEKQGVMGKIRVTELRGGMEGHGGN